MVMMVVLVMTNITDTDATLDQITTGNRGNLATRRQWGNIEKAILLSPIHSQRRARSGNGGAETSEVLPC
jgi:hypothetical protein